MYIFMCVCVFVCVCCLMTITTNRFYIEVLEVFGYSSSSCLLGSRLSELDLNYYFILHLYLLSYFMYVYIISVEVSG